MAQIISLVQEKGGCGKTTLVSSIAGWLAKDKAKVLIIDTDDQDGSCTRWVKKEATDDNITATQHTDDDTFYALIDKVKGDFDVILIDTAGYKSALATYAIQVSDLVLVPTKADELNAAGALRTWNHISNLWRTRQDKPEARVILADFDRNTRISEKISAALQGAGIEVISTPIFHATGFKEMFSTGGLPSGSAYKCLGQFMGALQTSNLINYYR